jgi:hypothetical protein
MDAEPACAKTAHARAVPAIVEARVACQAIPCSVMAAAQPASFQDVAADLAARINFTDSRRPDH